MNTLSQDFVNMLCCPVSRQQLVEADSEMVMALNIMQAKGLLQFCNGQPVPYALTSALVRSDQEILYPVRDGIPVLMVDEGIFVSSIKK